MNLKEKITQIAQRLEGWEMHQPSADNDQWIQIRKEGEREQPTICCRVDGYNAEIRDNTRLEFYGGWPLPMTDRSFYPYGERHSIGCAAKRTPASIAKAIQRRLLPAYLPKWEEMLEQKRKHIKDVAKRNADIAEIADILGKEVSRSNNQVYVAGGFFKARIGTFDIKLSGISMEVARQIAVIVASESQP